MIVETFEQIEPLLGTKAACAAVGRSRATHYRRRAPSPRTPRPPRPRPKNALASSEKKVILDALRSPRFVDQAPAQVWATLLDEGTYLASVSTMYRLLREGGEVGERRRQAIHPPRKRPELMATRPNDVWSWDITKLRGPSRGVWYSLYVILDIFSRFVPGWLVAPGESAEFASDLIEDAARAQGIAPNTLSLHADRGAPMTSGTLSELLARLEIGRSHSRPGVSNDNPFSEAQFRTLKYCPAFPEEFGSIEDAHAFCARFFPYYNHEHRHSGIGYHTPASVHYGTADEVRRARQETLDAVYEAHPIRFRNLRPSPPKLPTVAWINEPASEEAAQIS